MKPIFKHPMFLIGFLIRLLCILMIVPAAVSQWYIPFMQASIDSFSFDPWGTWLNHNQNILVFPYGYAMWLALLPLSFLSKILGLSQIYAYSLTLLIFDFGLLLSLRALLPSRNRLLLITYWLSPIVIFATYGLGLNDIIPVYILTLSLLFIRRGQIFFAGFALAVAMSAKLSMIIGLPIFVIYFINNPPLKQRLIEFLLGAFLGALLFILPFVFSSAGLLMVFNNPEMAKLYQFSINLTNNFTIYIAPLAYLLLLYQAWRLNRLNFELFQALIGVAFIIIVLFTPASPGWFVWSIPFLVIYQVKSGQTAVGLVTLFSIIYLFNTLLTSPLHFSNDSIFKLSDSLYFLGDYGEKHFISLLHTMLIGLGLILLIRIWRESVLKNDFFRRSDRPFIIGIAGDSGAGKDTFANGIAGLFGNHSVTHMSGDDYHLWDRHKPMWQVMTHLNPIANDLENFSKDLVTLSNRRTINTRHYDHSTGKITKPSRVKSNDFILASGLHALYLPALRGCYDLKIYLDINEDLRHYFKIKRDVHERGHSEEKVLNSLAKRNYDSQKFIRPQLHYADLILSLQPVQLDKFEYNHAYSPRLKLVVRTKPGFSEQLLNRILVGLCGLHVDISSDPSGQQIEMSIEGEVSAEDIALSAKTLNPEVFEFLDIVPKWQNDVLGLMQLITLAHINQALNKRLST